MKTPRNRLRYRYDWSEQWLYHKSCSNALLDRWLWKFSQYWRMKKKPRSIFPWVLGIGSPLVGGVGKTPIVIYLVEWFSHCLLNDQKIVVIHTGYGRKIEKPIIVDLSKPLNIDEALMGDESSMIIELLRTKKVHASVIMGIGRPRWPVIQAILDQWGKKIAILILDDAMQQREVILDKLIAVFPEDWKDLQGLGAMPLGPWREAPEAIQRADLLWIQHLSDPHLSQTCILDFWKAQKPCIASKYQISQIIRTREALQFQNFKALYPKVLLLTGVGRNQRVKAFLERKNLEIMAHLAIRDHKNFSPKIIRQALDFNYPILTTEKDWIRLRKLWPLNAPEPWRIGIEVVLTKQFQKKIQKFLDPMTKDPIKFKKFSNKEY